jgi:hypothetical protein
LFEIQNVLLAAKFFERKTQDSDSTGFAFLSTLFFKPVLLFRFQSGGGSAGLSNYMTSVTDGFVKKLAQNVAQSIFRQN